METIELELEDRVINLKTYNDYISLSHELMMIIVFNYYHSIVYLNMENDLIYKLLHNYCSAIIRYKTSKCKPSLLLCLSYMIQTDPNYNKLFAEDLFIKLIQGHFKAWYHNRRLRVSKKWFFRWYWFFYNMFTPREKNKFLIEINNIKVYCKNKVDYPGILTIYDKKTYNGKRQTFKLK